MFDQSLIEAWSRAFFLTLTIEAPIVLVGLVRTPVPRRVSTFLVANLISHPLLWFVFPRFNPYAVWLGVAEALVIAIEWQIFWLCFKSSYSRSYLFLVALCANTTSTLIGLALSQTQAS